MPVERQQHETLPFSFTGKGAEYFKIWIVNILLSILTLGIYSAWAKVRTQRYFYGNTFLQGNAFEYHARGIDILKGRVIAFAAVVIYTLSAKLSPSLAAIMFVLGALLLPWALWSGFRFNARVSSHRNVRFNFSGRVIDAYKVLLFLPLVPIALGVVAVVVSYVFFDRSKEMLGSVAMFTVLGFYLFLPYVQAMFTRYYFNHLQYGQGNFSADLKARAYYLTYIALLAWVMVAVAIGIGLGYVASWLNGEKPLIFGPSFTVPEITWSLIALILGLFLLSFAARAYLTTRLRNYAYSKMELDDVLRLQSKLKARSLFVMHVTNLLLVIFTLGLAIPWVKVRLARLSTETLSITTFSDIGEYVNQRHNEQSALGDELGEAFDMPADIGLSL